MSDKVSITGLPQTKIRTVEEGLKEQSRRRKLRNLKPYEQGHAPTGGRVLTLLKAIRAITGDGKQIAEFWLEVMNDPDAPMSMKMRASENLARCAWPALAPAPIEETNKAGYQTVDAGSIDSALDQV